MKAFELAKKLLDNPCADVKVELYIVSKSKYHMKTQYPIKIKVSDAVVSYSTTRKCFIVNAMENS